MTLFQRIVNADSTEEQVSSINDFLENFTHNPSHWSGKVIITSGDRHPGRYNRTSGDIYLDENVEIKTVIHELLHSRTDYDNTGLLASSKNGILNEASIEYYAEEICNASGIEYSETYKAFVGRLREIAQTCDMKDIWFASSLYNAPYSLRYDKLSAIVNNRSKELNLEREDKARLKKLVKSLKGSKEDLKKREISPIQQTKVVRTAQELIDLIDSGWSTAEEFIYIYSVLCNSDLPDDERSKFFESGRGNVIFESPLVGSIVEEYIPDKNHIVSVKKLKFGR